MPKWINPLVKDGLALNIINLNSGTIVWLKLKPKLPELLGTLVGLRGHTHTSDEVSAFTKFSFKVGGGGWENTRDVRQERCDDHEAWERHRRKSGETASALGKENTSVWNGEDTKQVQVKVQASHFRQGQYRSQRWMGQRRWTSRSRKGFWSEASCLYDHICYYHNSPFAPAPVQPHCSLAVFQHSSVFPPQGLCTCSSLCCEVFPWIPNFLSHFIQIYAQVSGRESLDLQ